jgi:hypothetical protein
MINLGGIEGLYTHDHPLAAYCPRCTNRRCAMAGQ